MEEEGWWGLRYGKRRLKVRILRLKSGKAVNFFEVYFLRDKESAHA